MKTKGLKIISGGQTGVDRAALDAALALGFPCGGTCPAGRFDESGPIPAHYPLLELAEGGYAARTVSNIGEADGTLVIYFGQLEGGTARTVARCIKAEKPMQLIDGDEVTVARAVELAMRFVRRHDIKVLNVAGPRASKSPQAHAYAFAVVTGLLESLERPQG